MSPFMLAFISTAVPALLWLFTLSEAARLPKVADVKPRVRVARFLLTQWPFLLVPIVLPICVYRLVQADLPAASCINVALLVFGPMLVALWLFRPTTTT
jgi:hypothetical protein